MPARWPIADFEAEMTVNLDTEDKTWLVHLDGLLTMLRRCEPGSNEARRLNLVEALHVLDNHATISSRSISPDGLARAVLLLEVLKLRLGKLASEASGMFRSGSRPRKLDVQKLKTGLKRVQRDSAVLPAMLDAHDFPHHDCKRNEHRALAIVAATLLLRCGEHLHLNGAYAGIAEYVSLNSSIERAAIEICNSLAFNLAVISDGSNPQNGARGTFAAFQAMWPLYSVYTSRTISPQLMERARSGLQRIGTDFKIPKALSLVI